MIDLGGMSCEEGSSERKSFEKFCSIATCAILDEILGECGKGPIKGKKQDRIDCMMSIQGLSLDDVFSMISDKSLTLLIKRCKILGFSDTRHVMTEVLRKFFEDNIFPEKMDEDADEYGELLNIAIKEMKGNSKFEEFLVKHNLVVNDGADEQCTHEYTKGANIDQRCPNKCSMIVIDSEIYKIPYCTKCMKNVKSCQIEMADIFGVSLRFIRNQVTKPKSDDAPSTDVLSEESSSELSGIFSLDKSSDNITDVEIQELGKSDLYPVNDHLKCEYIFTRGHNKGQKCGKTVRSYLIDDRTAAVVPYCHSCLKKSKLAPLVVCLRKIGIDPSIPMVEMITKKQASEDPIDYVCPFDSINGFWDRYFRLNIKRFIKVEIGKNEMRRFYMDDSEFTRENISLQKRFDQWITDYAITEIEIEQFYDEDKS